MNTAGNHLANAPHLKIPGYTPLHAAAAACDTAGVEDFITQSHFSPNVATAASVTPLMEAAANNCHETFLLLITLGADLHYQGDYLNSTTAIAAAYGHTGILQLLKNYNIELTVDALIAAAIYGQSDSVDYLLRNAPNMDINYVHPAIGSNALCIAIERKHADVAILLLKDKRTNTSMPVAGGLTAVHHLAPHGYSLGGEVAIPLLAHPTTNINAVTDDGNSVLHYAIPPALAVNCDPEYILFFCRHGANPTLQNNNGKTPADMLAHMPKTPFVTEACKRTILHALEEDCLTETRGATA